MGGDHLVEPGMVGEGLLVAEIEDMVGGWSFRHAACSLMAAAALVLPACSGGQAIGESPEQPIPFSHLVHANDHEIPCLYCHRYADRSTVAGAPAVKTCMGCHEIIGTDRPAIQKLTQHWENQEPIEWVKVYDLPDFVRFTHKGHLRAGEECESCHGPVRTMERIERITDLSMGWCLECHKQNDADIDCLICHH